MTKADSSFIKADSIFIKAKRSIIIELRSRRSINRFLESLTVAWFSHVSLWVSEKTLLNVVVKNRAFTRTIHDTPY